MSIATVVQTLVDDFAESGADAMVLLGRSHLAQRPEVVDQDSSFRRIVLVPTALQYGAPLEAGGNPRRAANRRQTLEVHVHARAHTQSDATKQHQKDLELAEALADQMVLALDRLPYPIADWSQPGAGRFGDDPKDLTFGAAVSFAVLVDIPVFDTPWVGIDDADPIVQGANVNAAGADVDAIGVG